MAAKKMTASAHDHKSQLDEKRLGLATGLVGALMGLLGAGARGMMGGGYYGGYGMMGSYGYGPLGALIGVLLAFVVMGIIGYAVAWVYNRV